jgi:hypothetical protein
MPYKDPEKRAEAALRYAAAHREDAKNKSREWYKNNKDRALACTKSRYEKNTEAAIQKQKDRYSADPDLYKKKAKEYRRKNFVKYLVVRLRRRASVINVPFDLTEEDLIVPAVCPVLGIPLTLEGGQRDDAPSVDRVVPCLGYTKGNVRVISMKANRIKNDATAEELRKVLQYLESSGGTS